MQKILFVCGRYFPKASPNSICVQNIIDELPNDEYNVHIICYKDGLNDETEANTTKVSRGYIQSTLYKLERKKTTFTSVLVYVFSSLQKIKQLLFYSVWPWCDPIVTLREILTAERLYQQNKYDIIVAVHMPLSSLITGHVIKKRHSRVQYIAYFLDSLSGGAAPQFMKTEVFNRKAIKWEKRLLQNADSIVFMEASRDYHKGLYKESELNSKIVYLDLPMLKSIEPIAEENENTLFVYVGSLAPSVRSPEFFLKVFSRTPEPSWRVIFVGDDSCDILNEFASKDKRITVFGRCTHEEALRYESQATVLLNIGNKNENLTPSKVFEYMSFGKKIVSTYPIPNESSIPYLKHYSNALLIDENSNIEETVIMLREFVNGRTEKVPIADLKKMMYKNCPEAFIEILNK